MEDNLDVYDLMRVLKRSRTTIYRWLAEGRIPEPDIRVTERSVYWSPGTIKRWQEKGCPRRKVAGGKGRGARKAREQAEVSS